MSPELLEPARFGSDGVPSRESDCYALGMTIYEVSDFISLWSPISYPSLGAQRSSPIPPPVASYSHMCDTQRGASGEASERLISRFH